MKRLNIKVGDCFGRLTVMKEDRYSLTKGGRLIRKFLCKCVCGNVVSIQLWHLKSGHTISCGCALIKHGLSKSLIYSTWENMIERCKNKYLKRGIIVCERWKKFENFLEDMGSIPNGKSLDRIDNNKGYYKENCRWATRIQQANNTSRNKYVLYKSEIKTVAELSKLTNIKYGTLLYRVNEKWGEERMFQQPTQWRLHANGRLTSLL